MIVRLPNWVGDVLMTLPALAYMQAQGIPLHLFGKSWARDLLTATGLPLSTLDKHFWQTKKKMATLSDDKALIFTNSFSSALMTRLAGKASIGYQRDCRGILLEKSLAKSSDEHEVQTFWNLAGFASNHWYPKIPWPHKPPPKLSLPLSSSAMLIAKQALESANIQEPFWVLCPFAHGRGKGGQSKIWPHWRELALSLAKHRLVVCPAKQEEQLCAQLVPNAIVLSGLNLSAYAAVLAMADKVIANDSGPMHMAAAVGTDTLGIFGVSDPNRTSPWGEGYIGSKDHWPALTEVVSLLG